MTITLPMPQTPAAEDGLPFLPLSARIQRFRDASRVRGGVGRPATPRMVHFEEAFWHRYAGRPYWERFARATAFALEHEPVYLFPDERLVGMLYQMSPNPEGYVPDAARWEPYNPWAQARTRIDKAVGPHASPGAPGHIGWRWDVILQEGVDGLLARLRDLLAHAPDAKAKRLYRGAIILWEAVLRWNDRHVAALEAARDAAVGDERARLDTLIEICRRVPREPARTFHEAVQAFHVQHQAIMFEAPHGGNGPGRVDYFLWPYLERDLADGRTTLEEAKELVDELMLRFQERLQPGDGWVEAVVPGGIHPDGSSAVNPLSHLIIHSIARLDQTHPVVYPRLSANGPEDYLDLCVHYLLHGQNRAQLYNDDACVPAIVASGTPPEDAAMYMAGGCMEISVQGMNCDLNFACVHEVAKTLEYVLTGGVDLRDGARNRNLSRDLTGYPTFDALYAAFERELARNYRDMVRALDIQSATYARLRPYYLLSSLVGDCLARGREQQDGGARYHEYGFAPLGISAAADALMGVKRAVYDEGFVSAAELLAALRANYQGYDALRQRLLRVPKFGMEDPEADALCNRVLHSVCDLAHRPRARFGGQLKPMIFNFVWTPWASAQLGARPDGACAGDYIGHGMTPQRRGMVHGLTAALNSCVSLDFSCVSGGATTMWDMDDRWITFDRMKAVLQVFLARGGMIFQGNTTSVTELEDALAHPDRYPNLIVRVGGFSARFCTLDADVQREIVARYRHNK
jgi:formate C-acetyltransferase